MKSILALAAFAILVVGGGLAIGYLTAPGEWYAGLAKPSFNPPASVFAPVWTVLYVLIALAGWSVWRMEAGGLLTPLWAAQLALNFAWSPVFFGAQRIGLGFVIILALLAAILCFIALAWRRNRAAALMFVPYAAWVGFAGALNLSIFLLN